MRHGLPPEPVRQRLATITHRAAVVLMTAVAVRHAPTTVARAIAATRGPIPHHVVAEVTTGAIAAVGATVLIRHAPTAAIPHGAIRRAAIPARAAVAVTRQATTGAHAPTRPAVTAALRAEAILLQAEAVAGVTLRQAGAAAAEATPLQAEAVAAAEAAAAAAGLPAQAGAGETSLTNIDFV